MALGIQKTPRMIDVWVLMSTTEHGVVGVFSIMVWYTWIRRINGIWQGLVMRDEIPYQHLCCFPVFNEMGWELQGFQEMDYRRPGKDCHVAC